MPFSKSGVGDMENAITSYIPKNKAKMEKVIGLFNLALFITCVYVALVVGSAMKYLLLVLLVMVFFFVKVWYS